MESKQAVAVAVGVGAVGTALAAYLGYSAYNNNQDISNLAEAQNNSWWANLWANSNTAGETLYNEVDDGPQLKAALNEEGKNVKVEKKESAWPTFWKESYDEDKKVDEEVTAADMN
jgi:hypothetical protein